MGICCEPPQTLCKAWSDTLQGVLALCQLYVPLQALPAPLLLPKPQTEGHNTTPGDWWPRSQAAGWSAPSSYDELVGTTGASRGWPGLGTGGHCALPRGTSTDSHTTTHSHTHAQAAPRISPAPSATRTRPLPCPHACPRPRPRHAGTPAALARRHRLSTTAPPAAPGRSRPPLPAGSGAGGRRREQGRAGGGGGGGNPGRGRAGGAGGAARTRLAPIVCGVDSALNNTASGIDR